MKTKALTAGVCAAALAMAGIPFLQGQAPVDKQDDRGLGSHFLELGQRRLPVARDGKLVPA